MKAQQDRPEGVAAGIQGGPCFRFRVVLGSPGHSSFAEGGQGTGQSVLGRWSGSSTSAAELGKPLLIMPNAAEPVGIRDRFQ